MAAASSPGERKTRQTSKVSSVSAAVPFILRNLADLDRSAAEHIAGWEQWEQGADDGAREANGERGSSAGAVGWVQADVRPRAERRRGVGGGARVGGGGGGGGGRWRGGDSGGQLGARSAWVHPCPSLVCTSDVDRHARTASLGHAGRRVRVRRLRLTSGCTRTR
eukprot:3617857-Rhodomonas_salina.1